MDKILEGLPEILDKATRTTLGLTILTILVLGGTIYLLFGSPFEFFKFLIFAIVATAYFGFVLVTGRL